MTSSTSPFFSTLNLFAPLTLYFPVLHKRLSHSYQHVGDMEEEQDGQPGPEYLIPIPSAIVPHLFELDGS